MLAAVAALRAEGPASIIVAVPVGSPEACAVVRRATDACVCALTPDPMYAVDRWYVDFTQTTDEEVHSLLADAARGYATRLARAHLEPHPLRARADRGSAAPCVLR